jgi:hypothetical protein
MKIFQATAQRSRAGRHELKSLLQHRRKLTVSFSTVFGVIHGLNGEEKYFFDHVSVADFADWKMTLRRSVDTAPAQRRPTAT